MTKRPAMPAALVALLACGGPEHDDNGPPCGVAADDRPMPAPVDVAAEPTVNLADPALDPLPGAQVEFGRLHGAVYQIEVPDTWNGSLLLWMHGYEELGREASVAPPDFRRFLIAQGFAWGASSFSSTSLIPGTAADETAALWDHFVATYERPRRSYVAGLSMGGWAAHIAASRYPDRFDGALGLCGAAGVTPGMRIAADLFVAGAFVAGVTQADYDASVSIGGLLDERIFPALEDPATSARYEDIMIDLTGGPRAFAREGFELEEELNWQRAQLAIDAGLVPPREAPYQLGPQSGVDSDEFNASAIRLRTNENSLGQFTSGMEVTGDLGIPLVTMHTTGDGQVPIDQARILAQQVGDVGKGEFLATRVIEDPGHCGFTTGEQEASFTALVDWVDTCQKPAQTSVSGRDFSTLDATFELLPRPGTPEADEVVGADQRRVVSGVATLDGSTFDARWLGAVVYADGLVTPCQYSLSSVSRGDYQITVLGDAESNGCGRPGAEVYLWTFAQGQKLYSTAGLAWPEVGPATLAAQFSTSMPLGGVAPVVEFAGEVYRPDGQHWPPGTRIEAYVGETRCGVASTRRTGSFQGYILSVLDAEGLGCTTGATVTFLIDGLVAVETVVHDAEQSGLLDLTSQR